MKNISVTIKKVIKTYRKLKQNANQELEVYSKFLENGVYKSNGTQSLFYNKVFKKNASFENSFLFKERYKKLYDKEIETDRSTLIGEWLFSTFYRYRVSSPTPKKECSICCQCLIVTSMKHDRKMINYKNNCIYTFFGNKKRMDDMLEKRETWQKILKTVPITEINEEKGFIKEEFIKKVEFDHSIAFDYILDEFIRIFENKLILSHSYFCNDYELNSINSFQNSIKTDRNKSTLINAFQEYITNPDNYKKCICHGDLSSNNLMFDGNSFYYIDFECSGEHYFIYDILFYIFNETFRYGKKELLNGYFNGKYDKKLEYIFELNNTHYNKELKKVYMLLVLFETYNGHIPEYYFRNMYLY